MLRIVLSLGLLAAAPALAVAQGAGSAGRQATPGPTSNPASANPATPNPAEQGTAGALLTTPQSAPPASGLPPLSPSGAPPDVMMTPK